MRRGTLVGATFLLVFFFPFRAYANSSSAQIIQEARCKVLIRGQIDAAEGDVVPVVRRAGSKAQVIGRVLIKKVRGNRTTGQVVEPRSDCRRLKGAFVQSLSAVGSVGGSISQPARRPPVNRGQVTVGPFLVSSALKGISRSTVLETYPLVLTAAKISGEVYPLTFKPGITPQSWQHSLGLDAAFNYVTSLNDIRVSIPAPSSGEELKLDLGVQRLVYRAGVIGRLHLWKSRLFLDTRTGYYSSKLTHTVKRFVDTPDGQSAPFEIAPLRDLSLGGFYLMSGVQFRPVQTFGTRLLAGVLLAPKYQVDNRVFDAKLGSPPVNSPVTAPRTLMFEADLNYIFGRFMLGLDVTIESFSGRALFPDEQNEGPIGEVHSSYGLNFAFLL